MPRPKISIATMMMLVVTAGSALALFAGINERWHGPPGEINPWPVVVVIAIVANGLILAALRKHAPTQAMLQITVVCVLFSAFIRWNEAFWVLLLLGHFLPIILLLVLCLFWISLAAVLMMESQGPRCSRRIKVFGSILLAINNISLLILEICCVAVIRMSIFD